MGIFNYTEFILEKTIGSEAIRLKHYSDIKKDIFYRLFKVDPTSVRKKDFSKPGKYFKWIMVQYKKGNFENVEDEYLLVDMNLTLFIFSTNWFRVKAKEDNVNLDIMTYPNAIKFMSMMDPYVEKYKTETDSAQFETVFSDDKVDVMIPMNFTASWEISKNTEWCTSSRPSFDMWSDTSILFRIIPKNKEYDILKLTWAREAEKWYIACSKYPEISGSGNPFYDKYGWEYEIGLRDVEHKHNEKWIENSQKIKETMSLLSDEAKNIITEYRNKIKSR
jgi:hypothetical protein